MTNIKKVCLKISNLLHILWHGGYLVCKYHLLSFRDQTELDPKAAWRLLELSANSTEQFLWTLICLNSVRRQLFLNAFRHLDIQSDKKSNQNKSFFVVKLQWIWQVLIIMLEDSQNLSLSLKSSFVDHMVWKLFYFVSVTINAYIFHGNYLLCSYFKCVKVLTCFRKFVNIYLLSKQLHFHPFSVCFSIWLKKM